ncbi:hypothetical protein PIB30_022357 [Stylosanthes scabra]|uniref:Ubiquitin-like protease family profile domain-containing protein n=1 Tax=Stylosanthes scabra TaxID=79078 RepID=A0ABU6W7M6_9FABA|nr:hypothetical protein [Stylosanthes scabra]
MKKMFKEDRERTRKAILYSLERSGPMSVPEKQPKKQLTLREELLKTFGSKSKGREEGPSTNTVTKRQRLDFDTVADSSQPDATEQGVVATGQKNPDLGVKYGYIGSLEFPQRLKVSFRPPPEMQFLITEVACGAYVFSKSKAQTEVLFEAERCSIERELFWTLRPKKIVASEIIDAVVTMLQHHSHGTYWWLPTSFQELALNPKGYYKDTLDYIVRKFMGYVDETSKIFVPLRSENHWYLMVVDFTEGENGQLVYLDSLKDVNRKKERTDLMDFVAFFMQTLFKDRKFYKRKNSSHKLVSTFDFTEPYIAQQLSTINDSRVWVAHWMQTANLWSNYNPEVVNNQHRYCLATSLMTTRANLKSMELSIKALKYYEGRDGTRELELSTPSDSGSSNGENAVTVASDSAEI